MMTYAIIAFALTAVVGLVMAAKVLSGKQAPWVLSLAHALVGATGLILLGTTTFNAGWPGQLTASLGLLVVAALGGFYLASYHLKGAISPKGIVLVHAGVAVTGVLVLLSVFFNL